jgi:hypothetical protein
MTQGSTVAVIIRRSPAAGSRSAPGCWPPARPRRCSAGVHQQVRRSSLNWLDTVPGVSVTMAGQRGQGLRAAQSQRHPQASGRSAASGPSTRRATSTLLSTMSTSTRPAAQPVPDGAGQACAARWAARQRLASSGMAGQQQAQQQMPHRQRLVQHQPGQPAATADQGGGQRRSRRASVQLHLASPRGRASPGAHRRPAARAARPARPRCKPGAQQLLRGWLV